MNHRTPNPAPVDWKALVVTLIVAIVLAVLVVGFARWADAVDFMQANTNAGCCGD